MYESINQIEHMSSLILAFSTFVLAMVGGIQLNKANRIRRAEFVATVNERFRFDESVTELVYKIDYRDFIYDKGFHADSSHQAEERLDALLSTLDYVCYLRDCKMLTKKEFHFYEYSIVWICKNENIQNYLWNMYHFAHKQYIHNEDTYCLILKMQSDVFGKYTCSCSFENLIGFCLRKKIIGRDFYSLSESRKYKRYYNPGVKTKVTPHVI